MAETIAICAAVVSLLGAGLTIWGIGIIVALGQEMRSDVAKFQELRLAKDVAAK